MAAIVRPKRMACPSQGTCSLRPSQRARPSVIDQRGQAERDQGGDLLPDLDVQGGLRTDLVDGADEHAARPGHRVLHLAPVGDDLEHLGADGVTVAVVLGEQLPERGRIEVEHARPRPGPRPARSPGSASSRVAACGSTPRGSMTRCRPTGDDGVVRVTGRSCQEPRGDRQHQRGIPATTGKSLPNGGEVAVCHCFDRKISVPSR